MPVAARDGWRMRAGGGCTRPAKRRRARPAIGRRSVPGSTKVETGPGGGGRGPAGPTVDPVSRRAGRDVALGRAGDLACMAVALFLGGLATDGTESVSSAYAPVNELVGLAAIVALWWRRRWPVPVAAATFLASAAAPMAGGAAIVGVYSVAAEHRGRRVSAGTSALYIAYLVCSSISLVVFRDEDLGVVGGALAAAVLTIAAYGWGLATRSRRDLLAALAERAERAEADQPALRQRRDGQGPGGGRPRQARRRQPRPGGAARPRRGTALTAGEAVVAGYGVGVLGGLPTRDRRGAPTSPSRDDGAGSGGGRSRPALRRPAALKSRRWGDPSVRRESR